MRRGVWRLDHRGAEVNKQTRVPLAASAEDVAG